MAKRTTTQAPPARRGRARRTSRQADRPGTDQPLPEVGSGVTVERDVRFRLPDGTVLLSDHYHPAGPGPFPTLLVRQPYGRAVASTVVHAQPGWFASQGYNVVIQDVRGRGDSTGRFYPFRHEGRDGAATIEWLASRPECNGRVGMYGFSYQGLTQLLAAAEGPTGLRCIAPAQTAGDLHSGWFYHQGAYRLASGVGWALQMLRADARKLRLRSASRALEEAATRLPSLLAAAPYSRIDCLTARGLPTYHRDWTTRRLPGPWWSRHDVTNRLGRINVPTLHLWGWFDTFLDGSEQLYQGLRVTSGAPQFLVAGPWVHIPWSRRAGEVDHGPEAVLDTDRLLLRWFNHWLKDSGEFDREPPVRSFALGENRWHRLAGWPRGFNGESGGRRWYLDSDGRANSIHGDGRLSEEPPRGPRPRDGFVHEPEVPVASPGPGAAPGPHLQDRQDSMNNVLAYTSPALPAALRIAGRPRVRLHATSRMPSADLVAKLVRVLADGRSYNVCIGIARSTWMFGPGGLVPDRIQCWEFDLEPTHCVFAAGERLRLVVSGSAFPLYDRNPGCETPPGEADSWDWRQNQQQVLHGADHPSSLWLPLEPGPAPESEESPRP